MECPKELIIKVASSERLNLCNLVVYITLLATKKNNYSLGPYLTNRQGEVRITKEMIKQEIQKTMKDFLMDYADRIEDCQNEILIEIESKDSLSKIWQGTKKYYPEYAQKIKLLIDGEVNFIPNKIKRTIKILPEQDTYEVLL